MPQISAQPLLAAGQILDNLLTAVLLIDHEFRVVAANSAAEHLISISERGMGVAIQLKNIGD